MIQDTERIKVTGYRIQREYRIQDKFGEGTGYGKG